MEGSLWQIGVQFVLGHNVSVENTYASIVVSMMRQKTSVRDAPNTGWFKFQL